MSDANLLLDFGRSSVAPIPASIQDPSLSSSPTPSVGWGKGCGQQTFPLPLAKE